MTNPTVPQFMFEKIVLLPWDGPSADEADVGTKIWIMGGEIAYGKASLKDSNINGGKDPSTATHEYVPDGAVAITNLPVLTETEFKTLFQNTQSGLSAFLADYTRATHVPVVTEVGTPGRESRYFGKPWMADGMEWPSLNGKPMDFVLQLDLSSLPDPHSGPKEGLLLFFSSNEYVPDKDSHFAIVSPAASGGLRDTPDGTHENNPLYIESWRTVDDHPWVETLSSMDGYEQIETILESLLSLASLGMLTDLDGNNLSEKDAVESGSKAGYHCYECDKLGGWPRWEQGDDTPKDRNGSPMQFLMQVGHEGVIIGDFDSQKIEWPTWGRGQIFVSPETGEFKYVWACD